MATISKSFTGVGVSSPISVEAIGDEVTFSISGTYNATIVFERAVTADGTSWEAIPSSQVYGYSTANATVVFVYTVRKSQEKFRTRCVSYTSGTVDTSITNATPGIALGSILQTGSSTAKDIAVWGASGTLQDGSNTTAPFLLKSSNGILAKFDDNGTVVNYPIFTAAASGGLTISSSATNGDILLVPNGTGVVEIGNGGVVKQLRMGNANTRTFSTTITPLFLSDFNSAGTITEGTPKHHYIAISSDVADASAASNAVATFMTDQNFGGVGYKGSRSGIRAQLTQTGSMNSSGVAYGISAGEFWVNANNNNGGTDTDAGAAGQYYGIYPQVQANNAAATNLYGIFGGEIDIKAVTGSSMKCKAGLTIVQLTNDAVQGAQYDVGLGFSNQRAPNAGGNYPIGWNFGIAFGRLDGIWPIHPTTGTIMGTYPTLTDVGMNKAFGGMASKYGIDFPNIEPTTYSFRVPAFWIDPVGVTKIGPATISPTTAGLTIDANGSYVSSVAVNAGGTGYVVGDHVYDGLGGVYNISTVSGTVITGLTIVNKAYSTSAPSNPVSLTGGHGTGANVNLTWTASPALSLNLTGDTIVGKQSAKATTDTTGYMLIPFVAGTPTGVPTNASKGAAMVYDTTGHKLWIYDSGWKSATFA